MTIRPVRCAISTSARVNTGCLQPMFPNTWDSPYVCFAFEHMGVASRYSTIWIEYTEQKHAMGVPMCPLGSFLFLLNSRSLSWLLPRGLGWQRSKRRNSGGSLGNLPLYAISPTRWCVFRSFCHLPTAIFIYLLFLLCLTVYIYFLVSHIYNKQNS